MANAPDRATTDPADRDFDVAALIRTASWGIGAAAALFLAMLAGISESGAPRVAVAISTLTGKIEKAAAASVAAPAPDAVGQPQLVTETQRLHEQVRLLAADRDGLVQRVGALEHNLEDVTGSIRRQEASSKQAPTTTTDTLSAPPAAIAVSPAPWPAIAPAQPATAPWNDPPPHEASSEVTASLPPATPLPPPRPEMLGAPGAESAAEAPAAKPDSQQQAMQTPKPEAPPTRAAYGVDLGGAVSVDRLRMLWRTLRTNEAMLLQGLRPVTQSRAAKRGRRPDVRLIAGPLPNADAAARLCAAILNAGRYCEPAVFHGQGLSLR